MCEMSQRPRRGRPPKKDRDSAARTGIERQASAITGSEATRLNAQLAQIIALLEEIAYQGMQNRVEREAFLQRIYKQCQQSLHGNDDSSVPN